VHTFRVSRHSLLEVSSIRFHEYPSSGSPAFTCGQTDGRTDKTEGNRRILGICERAKKCSPFRLPCFVYVRTPGPLLTHFTDRHDSWSTPPTSRLTISYSVNKQSVDMWMFFLVLCLMALTWGRTGGRWSVVRRHIIPAHSCDMVFVIRHLRNMATMRNFVIISGKIMYRTRIPYYVRDEFVTKQ
jgi:hypothetical protein